MISTMLGRYPHLVGVSLVAALTCGLYLPFLGNPPVFDDQGFFSGRLFSYYATHPLDLGLRVPPYFTLAMTQVLSGRIETHRIISLAFHLAASLALYRLIYDLWRATGEPRSVSISSADPHAATWAFIGAAAFAVHPVAVYGAAYLVQRSIVLATLFSLLSIALFIRGLARGSHADAVSAALMYTLAVLCKEHSVLLPATAVLAVPLVTSERRFALRHAVIYLLACAPAAIIVALLSKGLIGEAYESDFGMLASQLERSFGRDIADYPWPLSAVTQAGLFFRYVFLWVWPDTDAMSIDLRVDFLTDWSPGWILLKVTAFAAWGALGFLLLRRRGRAGLAGFGLLYVWILYLIELSVARFQEPFVLYRNYLWAPGILIALIALVGCIPRRAALATFVFACTALLYQAHDRLVTFSSSLALWEDAVAKLPADPVAGGSRTLYGLGREYLYAGRPDKAIAITDQCMARYPDTVYCYYARGAIYLHLEEFERALPYLTRARELQPDNGIIYHRLGLVVENLGRVDEAKTLYRRASELGFKGGDYEIIRLESPGRGLAPPRKTDPARTPMSRPGGAVGGASTLY